MTSFTFIGLGLVFILISILEYYKIAKQVNRNMIPFVNEHQKDKIQIISSSIMLGFVLIAFGTVKFYN